MQKAIEQFAALNKRGFEAALSAWDVAFRGAEQWSRLNIEASKALLVEAAEQSKALTTVKTPEELTAFGSGAANTTFERTIGYSRHCQQIATQAQGEAAKWLKSAVEEIKQDMEKSLDGIAASAPQPTKDAALAALQQATTWTDSVVEASKQIMKQGNEFTEAAINATAEAVKGARGKKVFA